MSVAAEITKAAGGARIDNGVVTELKLYGSAQYAVIDLGGKLVEAKVPGHLRGPVTVGASVQIVGDSNTRVILGVLSEFPWITAGFAASSGWSIDYAGYRWSMGPYISIVARVLRTGSTITASASGHLADTPVLTAPAGCLPAAWPINSIPFVWRTSWSIGGGYVGPVTGILQLADLHPNASISAGDQMQMQVTYPV